MQWKQVTLRVTEHACEGPASGSSTYLVEVLCQPLLSLESLLWEDRRWWGSEQDAPGCDTLANKLFQAESNQGPKDWGRNFYFPPQCQKEFGWRLCSRQGAITADTASWYDLGRWTARNVAECWLRSLSKSFCSCVAQHTFVHQTFTPPYLPQIALLPPEARGSRPLHNTHPSFWPEWSWNLSCLCGFPTCT